ncbi:MAG: lysophospholipid acyltransferase family protein [Syntrophomonadaceae bacterium]|nr:lysophospholipid acyltransferase family protein [Syntrophomonadaceae bacterium]MDD3888563.1 lysophospholipid acyltransferase family protein [Syntrophomonadaceae bacterium]MDD4548595.1 lysophospholipid acyltransferase family protein [Syntrophomonadaceae bacterium]
MFYSVIRDIAKLIFIFLGFKSEGIHNLPEKGPVIIAANHVSNWDPVLVAISVKRPICFMAKAELFSNKGFAKVLKTAHAFPVKRGQADRKALKYALEILEQGKVLGIFPEGARKKVVPDAKVQSGVALIALKSGAPVIPIACKGTDRGFPLGWTKPLVVRVGEPINLEKYEGQKLSSSTLEQVSKEIMNEINTLLSR